jgi:hypothetical protein
VVARGQGLKPFSNFNFCFKWTEKKAEFNDGAKKWLKTLKTIMGIEKVKTVYVRIAEFRQNS